MRSLPRDLEALIDYTRQLELIREHQLERGVSGRPILAPELAQAEAVALQRMRQRYFNAAMRRAARGDEGTGMTDEQDFAQRALKLADEATLENHRRLAAMPFVGQPDFNAVASVQPLTPARHTR